MEADVAGGEEEHARFVRQDGDSASQASLISREAS